MIELQIICRLLRSQHPLRFFYLFFAYFMNSIQLKLTSCDDIFPIHDLLMTSATSQHHQIISMQHEITPPLQTGLQCMPAAQERLNSSFQITVKALFSLRGAYLIFDTPEGAYWRGKLIQNIN